MKKLLKIALFGFIGFVGIIGVFGLSIIVYFLILFANKKEISQPFDGDFSEEFLEECMNLEGINIPPQSLANICACTLNVAKKEFNGDIDAFIEELKKTEGHIFKGCIKEEINNLRTNKNPL
jgi:hypothetical protein